MHKLESMVSRSVKTVCCLVWRAWLEEGLESLVQPKQAGGTVAVHCSRSTGRYWDKGLLNTAEDIAELQVVEGTEVPVGPGLLGQPVVLEHTGCIVVAVAAPHIGTGLAGMGPGTGIGQRLEPWDSLEDCNKFGYIRVHRHPGILQGRSGSLKIVQIKKVFDLVPMQCSKIKGIDFLSKRSAIQTFTSYILISGKSYNTQIARSYYGNA